MIAFRPRLPWPRSLFGRLALLLFAVLGVGIAGTILLFRQDRAALLARQFSDTKIVQLQALRAALAAVEGPERREHLLRLGREYGVSIVPERDRPMPGGAPTRPVLVDLEQRLAHALGPGTAVRIQPRLQLLWVRIEAREAGYWVGFPLPPRPQADDVPSRAALWSLSLAAILLFAAFLFTRYLARPLRQLSQAVDRLARGEVPAPLPESGPSEIANVNRGFNQMMTSLARVEQDRALLLAGVSHDLRTPLARLRLGLELAVKDDATRRGMIDDIEEMDRIVHQFLDFARAEREAAPEPADPIALVTAAVERYRRAGREIAWRGGPPVTLPLRSVAFSRLVTNLVDNALAYGAPPVEIVAHRESTAFVLEVIDHGPGIPPGEVERLKQPFTRASAARANAAGIPGAGLGLAIVERIARLHGGSFELLPRTGGGTVTRVALPWAAPAAAGSGPVLREGPPAQAPGNSA